MASCGPSRDRPGGVSQPIVEVGCSEPFGFELQRGAWKALWSEDPRRAPWSGLEGLREGQLCHHGRS